MFSSFIKPYLTHIVVGVIVILLLACAWLYASKASVEKDLTEATAALTIAKGVIKSQEDNNRILTSANEGKALEIEILSKINGDTNERVSELTNEKNQLQKRLDRYLQALPVTITTNACQETSMEKSNSLQRMSVLWKDFCTNSTTDPYCQQFNQRQGEAR